jgi:hypothetical protein
MYKNCLKIVVTILISALLGSNFAYKATLATETDIMASEAPNASQAPQNSPNLTAGDSVKQGAQSWMQKAQNWLTEASGKAYESASEAARQEISRQINKQIKATENQATSKVKSVVDIIKESIGRAVTKIKIFFVNLKNRIFKSDTNLSPYR